MPIERRTMTPDELQAIERMHFVTFPVASWDKRFYRSLAGRETISEKESAQLWRLFIRYRRQVDFPDKARLLRVASKLSAPDFRKAQSEQRRKDEERAKYEAAMGRGEKLN